MSEIRSNIELLQVLLDNISKLRLGLCDLTLILRRDGLISIKEEVLLYSIIKDNPTVRYLNTYSVFYFECGNIPLRIEYLQGLIRKLKYS